MHGETLESIPLFAATRRVNPVRFADTQHRRFARRNLRIGSSRTVHATAWTHWLDGLTLPAPACRQGWCGLGATGELSPTRDAPTCRKCRRLHGLAADDDSAQTALFTL